VYPAMSGDKLNARFFQVSSNNTQKKTHVVQCRQKQSPLRRRKGFGLPNWTSERKIMGTSIRLRMKFKSNPFISRKTLSVRRNQPIHL